MIFAGTPMQMIHSVLRTDCQNTGSWVNSSGNCAGRPSAAAW